MSNSACVFKKICHTLSWIQRKRMKSIMKATNMKINSRVKLSVRSPDASRVSGVLLKIRHVYTYVDP